MSYLKISPFLENLVFEQSPAGRESDLKTEYIVICKNVDSFPCLLLLNDSKLLKFWLLTYLCLIRHSHCIPIQPLSCTNSVQHGITWNKNLFIIRNLISAIVALRHPQMIERSGEEQVKENPCFKSCFQARTCLELCGQTLLPPDSCQAYRGKTFPHSQVYFPKVCPTIQSRSAGQDLVSGIVVFQFRVG